MRYWPIVALLLLSALACGCNSVPDADEKLVPDDMQAAPTPIVPWRIGMLPVYVSEDYRQRTQETNGRSGKRRYSYLVPSDVARKVIEDLANAVDSKATTQTALNFCEAARWVNTEGRQLSDLIREGFENGLDVIARPVLKRSECSYVGESGDYGIGIALWILSPLPSWFVADETFAAEFVIEWEFYSTASQDLAPDKTPVPFLKREVKAETTQNANDFDQGFNLLNLFITPDDMSNSAWDDLGNRMNPLVRQAWQRDMLDLIKDPNGLHADLEKARNKLNKAVVVLAGTAPRNGDRPRFADKDVAGLRETFTNSLDHEPFVKEWALKSLAGTTATRSNLLAAVKQAFNVYARHGDRAVLFLNMQGIQTADEAYLLCADSDPARYKESGLPMKELVEALRDCPANVMVIGAVHWNWPDGNAPEIEGAVEGVGPLPKPWAELTKLPNVVLLTANGDGSETLEIDQIPGSLFVAELRRVIESGADADKNGDGWLSWNEVALPTIDSTYRLSEQEAVAQKPAYLGANALKAARIFRLRNGADLTSADIDPTDAPAATSVVPTGRPGAVAAAPTGSGSGTNSGR